MSLRWPKPLSSQTSSSLPGTTQLRDVRYIILDTELTSLNPRDNRLLSIGAIAMTGTRIHLGEQFYCLVNPGVEVPAPGIVIHKLMPNEIANGDAPADALEGLRQFIEGSVLVGHFIEIDVKAIRKELAIPKHDLAHPAIDTARVHRWILARTKCAEDAGHSEAKLDLTSLAASYGLDVHEPHHALADAFLTARLWQKLLCSIERLGIRDLGGLLRIGCI